MFNFEQKGEEAKCQCNDTNLFIEVPLKQQLQNEDHLSKTLQVPKIQKSGAIWRMNWLELEGSHTCTQNLRSK